MKPAKEANKLVALIVALKAEKRWLNQAIDLRRRILAGEGRIEQEQEKKSAVQNEIMLFGA